MIDVCIFHADHSILFQNVTKDLPDQRQSFIFICTCLSSCCESIPHSSLESLRLSLKSSPAPNLRDARRLLTTLQQLRMHTSLSRGLCTQHRTTAGAAQPRICGPCDMLSKRQGTLGIADTVVATVYPGCDAVPKVVPHLHLASITLRLHTSQHVSSHHSLLTL